MTNTTQHTPELSFDGKGINGSDIYRTRLATFTTGATAADVEKYGNLFAAAPELLAALENLLCEYYRISGGSSNLNDQRQEVITARAAIAKAKGGSL